VSRDVRKKAHRIGALPGLDAGEKINFQPVKQTRAKTTMKTWAIVVGVLIVLFCLRIRDRQLLRHIET
jgi:hypothetical protein